MPSYIDISLYDHVLAHSQDKKQLIKEIENEIEGKKKCIKINVFETRDIGFLNNNI